MPSELTMSADPIQVVDDAFTFADLDTAEGFNGQWQWRSPRNSTWTIGRWNGSQYEYRTHTDQDLAALFPQTAADLPGYETVGFQRVGIEPNGRAYLAQVVGRNSSPYSVGYSSKCCIIVVNDDGTLGAGDYFDMVALAPDYFPGGSSGVAPARSGPGYNPDEFQVEYNSGQTRWIVTVDRFRQEFIIVDRRTEPTSIDYRAQAKVYAFGDGHLTHLSDITVPDLDQWVVAPGLCRYGIPATPTTPHSLGYWDAVTGTFLDDSSNGYLNGGFIDDGPANLVSEYGRDYIVTMAVQDDQIVATTTTAAAPVPIADMPYYWATYVVGDRPLLMRIYSPDSGGWETPAIYEIPQLGVYWKGTRGLGALGNTGVQALYLASGSLYFITQSGGDPASIWRLDGFGVDLDSKRTRFY